ncbi:MAG: hypothetical protein H0W62_05760 [Chitinophagales bacterium]|nr:hypothetical protein [Chitinophagales bacterium]
MRIITLFLLFSIFLSSCSVVSGIFNAGMGFGIFIVILVLVLIVWLFMRSNKR